MLSILRPSRATMKCAARAQCPKPSPPIKGRKVLGWMFSTDPEPGVARGQAAGRNMRSKCRCSCVLQFTFRRAFSGVLHRPPSQVIHCTALCFFSEVVSVSRAPYDQKMAQLTAPQGGKKGAPFKPTAQAPSFHKTPFGNHCKREEALPQTDEDDPLLHL